MFLSELINKSNNLNMFGFGKKIIKKVMIVEDDTLLANILSEALKKENFEVIIVSDGLEALNAAEKTHPSVILLDLILPGIDGFEVLKKLKENDKTSQIPIVIISNLDSISDVKSGKALGAEKYFVKASINLNEIVKYVKTKF